MGCKSQATPAILERPHPLSCAFTAWSTHDVLSSRQETLATHSLGALEMRRVLSRASTATSQVPGCWGGPEPANVLAPDQPVWQTTGLPGILLISNGECWSYWRLLASRGAGLALALAPFPVSWELAEGGGLWAGSSSYSAPKECWSSSGRGSTLSGEESNEACVRV